MNMNFEEYPQNINDRLSVALGRKVNLNHDKVHDLVFELVEKVEHYQSEYQDTVNAIRKHLTKGTTE
jgi:hypothetical protein